MYLQESASAGDFWHSDMQEFWQIHSKLRDVGDDEQEGLQSRAQRGRQDGWNEAGVKQVPQLRILKIIKR